MTDANCEAETRRLPGDAHAIRDEQVERALKRLEEHGRVTPRQRATVERLADRLAVELLALFETDPKAIESADAGDGENGVALFSD